MTLSQRDLAKLALPGAIMLALWLLAGLIAWNTHHEAESAARERSAAENSRSQVEQRLNQIRSEEQEIKERAQMLQRLRSSGVVGAEQRLDWIETLSRIQRELRLPGMKYELGARTKLEGGQGEGNWFASPMRIQFRLLHEQDLLDALDRIEREAQALVIARSCQLAPLPNTTDNSNTPALLGADCELQWVTVAPSGGQP